MNNLNSASMEKEVIIQAASGWLILPMLIILLAFDIFIVNSALNGGGLIGLLFALVVSVGLLVSLSGFTILHPNQAVAYTLFGSYHGTLRKDGFWFVNPLMSGTRISLKIVSHSTATLKVNDSSGSPIEIAAVVTAQVSDTRRALFSVEDWESFFEVQSEAAIRQVASQHPYERADGDDKPSLRSDIKVIVAEAKEILQSQVNAAGVAVIDVRISHLAYAPEIAQTMLRRQQATAVIQARTAMAEGAVGIVNQILEGLAKDEKVKLSDDQKATLICNMMPVLVSEDGAKPVIPLSAPTKNKSH